MDNELIYLDTNIYMDYFLIREDRLRPLSDFAFELLRKTFQCEYKIAISDWLLFELENNIPIEKINELLNDLKDLDKLVKVERTDGDIVEAKKHKNWKDALHAVLAKKSGAVYLVTRNVEDFFDVQNLIEIKLPENL
jgi:predicted nucleic acid-binding protein